MVKWPEIRTALFIILGAVLLFTWPLALHFADGLPTGNEGPAVALVHLFSLEWTGAALDGRAPYWDAPYFYPFRGAFAWCEPQLLSGIAAWPIAKAAGYVFAYNFIMVLYMVILGLAGYCLTRLLTEDRAAALWCGLWLAAGSFALQQAMASMPLVASGVALFCVYFLLCYLQRRKAVFLWLATAAYLATWFTCKQTAFYLAVLSFLVLIPFMRRPFPRPAVLGQALAALAVVFALAAPYSLQQFGYTNAMGFQRLIRDVRGFLYPAQLFVPAHGHWLATRIWGLKVYSWSLGIVPLAVLFAGLFLARGAAFKEKDPFRRRTLLALVLTGFIALILSFGPRYGITVNGRHYGPYQLLFYALPWMRFIRAPVRIIFFAIAATAVFSALSLARLRERIQSPFARTLATLGLFALLSAEMWCVPLELVFPGKFVLEHKGVDEWLSLSQNRGALLELPSSVKMRPDEVTYETQAMLRMVRHLHPVANGYASFDPYAYYQLREGLENDPQGRGRRFLDAYGVRYVLVHLHRLPPGAEAAMAGLFGNNVAYRDEGHLLYILPPRQEAVADFRKALPGKIRFRREPRVDMLYSLPLSAPRDKAFLITPETRWEPEFEWLDKAGVRRSKRVRILGDIIVDIGDPGITVRLTRFSVNGQDAEAVIVPPIQLEHRAAAR